MQWAIWPLTGLKTYSQSVTVKKAIKLYTRQSRLKKKTLIEGDFTISSFRQFQTSLTLIVKKYFLCHYCK